jgi:ferritin-like metal-binding protein YciE
MSKINDLNDLFVHTLKDIYFAEKHILKAMPGMIDNATSPDLKKAIESHRTQTETHVDRLEKVFELIGEDAKAVKCPAIEGIVTEAKELMDETSDGATRDAAIIAAAQAVEHYEITRYGTLATWAEQLGNTDARDLLRETLGEEEETDEKLTRLAEDKLNQKAV